MKLLKERKITIALLVLTIVFLSTSVFLYYRYIVLNNSFEENLNSQVNQVYKIRSLDDEWDFEGFIAMSNNEIYLKVDSLSYIGQDDEDINSIKYKIYTYDNDRNKIDKLIYSAEEKFQGRISYLKNNDKLLMKSGSKIKTPNEMKFNLDNPLKISVEYELIDGTSNKIIIGLELSNYNLQPYL